MRNALILLVALLLVPAATAQDDACSQASPCTWAVEVDADGLSAPGGDLEGTVGDWFVFEFNNVDPDNDHTVSYSADGGQWRVEYLSTQTTEPFRLDEEGTFQLEDDVSGATLPVKVTLEDVVDSQAGGDGGDGSGSGDGDDEGDEVQDPFAPTAWILLALAGLVFVIRRR